MNATHQLTTAFSGASARSSNNARHHLGFLSFVRRTKQLPAKNEVSAAKWPKDKSRMRGNPDRQLRLPRARTDGNRMPPVRSRTALKMHEETMSDTWRSPTQKPKSAIQSGQRTTTSTPNITSERCARIQKERKGLCRDGRSQPKPSEAETRWD